VTARPLVFAGNALRAARKRGPFFLAGLGLRWATLPLWRRSWRGRTFRLGGETYPYLLHNYNLTWSNERAVEVPIAWREVERRPAATILEVGNVLSHYYRFGHDVVDKFERAPGVANLDVVDLPARERYDLVVTISTLEHVGWDEEPKDPEKPLRAMDALRRVLAPGGLLVATIPLGYNPGMDRLLDARAFGWTEQRQMMRVSDDNRWVEAEWDAVKGCRYDDRWPGASGLVIGFIRP
jgi:SAM-dependent methyltransferase